MLFKRIDKKIVSVIFLLFCYFVLLACICNSIGCSSGVVRADKEVIQNLRNIIDSGILNPVAGDSEKIVTDKLHAAETIKKSLFTIHAREEPEKKGTLDKIFNIGIIFIVMIVLVLIYKVFKIF